MTLVSSGHTPAYPTPPWPFDQVPTFESTIIGQRFYPNFPLVQDPIAHALAVCCDWQCEDINGPEPVFGDTLGKQLDALRCDYVLTYPDTHPERIEWGESVRRVSVSLAELATAPGNALAFELARMVSPVSGVVRVETIDTWLRASINGVSIELSAMPNTANANGSPFALPLVFGAMGLTWEWALVHSRFGWVGGTPLWLTGASPTAIQRGTDLLAPWTDNRYAWGSFRQRGLQYQAGQHGLVRLFCTVRGTGTPATVGTLELAGSLTGFHQSAGRDAAAAHNVTTRV